MTPGESDTAKRMVMTRINTSKARNEFSKVLKRVARNGDRIILHRRGKDVAALVPLEDFTLLEELEDRIDLEEAHAALEEAKTKGTIPWEKIKAEIGL